MSNPSEENGPTVMDDDEIVNQVSAPQAPATAAPAANAPGSKKAKASKRGRPKGSKNAASKAAPKAAASTTKKAQPQAIPPTTKSARPVETTNILDGLNLELDELDDFPEDWQPAGQLEAPKALIGPDGAPMEQRWIRMNVHGHADPQNRAAKIGQGGWRPRGMNTVPEGERGKFPCMRDVVLGDIIATGALVLCHMPQYLFRKRKRYYDARRKGQLAAVDAQIANTNKVQRPGYGPIHVEENVRSVSHREPQVLADE